MKKGGFIQRNVEKIREWRDSSRSELPKKNAKRAAKAKADDFGPPGFSDFVRASGCVVARQSGSLSGCVGPVQHCHRKSRGAGGGWRDNSFGACLGHHAEGHAKGQQTFERAHDLDLDIECLAITNQWDIRQFNEGE